MSTLSSIFPRRLSTPIALLLVAICTQTSLGQYKPVVGQPHADFVLPRIDDRKPVSLSQYRGKKVLLLHFASW